MKLIYMTGKTLNMEYVFEEKSIYLTFVSSLQKTSSERFFSVNEIDLTVCLVDSFNEFTSFSSYTPIRRAKLIRIG